MSMIVVCITETTINEYVYILAVNECVTSVWLYCKVVTRLTLNIYWSTFTPTLSLQ